MAKIKVTESYAKEFDKRCAVADSHGFLGFITKPMTSGETMLDLMSKVGRAVEYMPSREDRAFELDEKKISCYMNEFFSIYMPQKASEVKQILNRTHPLFTDSDGGSHVTFERAQKYDPRTSSVGHTGRQSFLSLNVYTNDTISDLRITAHELSHALSAHHQYLVKTLRSNLKEHEDYKDISRKFDRDCIGEIESHITERLFNRFLVKKGLYGRDDLENYEKQQQASLLNETNLIREEQDIVRNLSCPINYESLNNLVKNLQKNGDKKLLARVETMHNSDKKSSYMFRYVVGRIVADQWNKKFDNAPNKKAKTEMLDKFQQYLDKTHELDLDGACKYLLGKNFTAIAEDYIKDKTKEKDKRHSAGATA